MAREDRRFNRGDCPYGCGARLPSHIRLGPLPVGGFTACPGCGRWLYPMRALFDGKQALLWPPPHVPRSSEATTNPDLLFVVGKDDYVERQDIVIERHRAATAWEQSWLGLMLFGLLEMLAFVAAMILSSLLEAWDRLRGHETRRRR